MKSLFNLVFIFVVASTLVSCVEKSDPALDKQSFNSIFDQQSFSAEVYPIDVKETSDGGYLVLAERRIQNSNFRGVYLLKADANGKFVAELEMEDQYVNPIGDLMEVGGSYYFFCMSSANVEAQLVQADESAGNITITPVGTTYPSAAALDGSNLLLLSYNHGDKVTVMSRHSTDGSIEAAIGYSIGAGDEVEEPIINHFIHTAKRFPFQVGKMPGGSYFFNGFVNYTFSLVFTDFSSNSGIVQGQQDDGGISALYPLGSGRFAAARFNFGDNYFLPNATIETSGISSADDLGGNVLPELVHNAPVRIASADTDTDGLLIFASDTKSKQIGLFFYNATTGAFRSSLYLGFSNPFELANIRPTTDEGLIVCGTTYLAGRFPRITLIKLSRKDLEGQLQ